MPGFRVTPRAQDDLKNIGRYTEQQWGSRRQRNSYLKVLEKRFGWLAENPQLGKHRPDVAEGYYSFPQGEHVVFYLIGEKSIEIIGVPHKEMDIITYFLPDLSIKYKGDMPNVASRCQTLPAGAGHSHSIVNKPFLLFIFNGLFVGVGGYTMKNTMFRNFFKKVSIC